MGSIHRPPFVLHPCRSYSPEKKWPVILFLHGAGERGTDGLKQSQVGLGSAVDVPVDRDQSGMLQLRQPMAGGDQQEDRGLVGVVAQGAPQQGVFHVDRVEVGGSGLEDH